MNNAHTTEKIDCRFDTYIMRGMDGRGVFMYTQETPVGDVQFVEYEDKAWGLTGRRIFDNDMDKATAYFKRLCHKMIDGDI